MAGFTYSTLTTAIQNYTEVGTGVLSSTITDQFIDKNYEDLLGVSNSSISLEYFIDYDWDSDVFGR